MSYSLVFLHIETLGVLGCLCVCHSVVVSAAIIPSTGQVKMLIVMYCLYPLLVTLPEHLNMSKELWGIYSLYAKPCFSQDKFQGILLFTSSMNPENDCSWSKWKVDLELNISTSTPRVIYMLDTKACCVHAVCCVAWGVLWVVVCCIVTMAEVLMRVTLTLQQLKTKPPDPWLPVASCAELELAGRRIHLNLLEMTVHKCVWLVGWHVCVKRRMWAQTRAGSGVKWTDSCVLSAWRLSVSTVCW